MTAAVSSVTRWASLSIVAGYGAYWAFVPGGLAMILNDQHTSVLDVLQQSRVVRNEVIPHLISSHTCHNTVVKLQMAAGQLFCTEQCTGIPSCNSVSGTRSPAPIM